MVRTDCCAQRRSASKHSISFSSAKAFFRCADVGYRRILLVHDISSGRLQRRNQTPRLLDRHCFVCIAVEDPIGRFLILAARSANRSAALTNGFAWRSASLSGAEYVFTSDVSIRPRRRRWRRIDWTIGRLFGSSASSPSAKANATSGSPPGLPGFCVAHADH